MKDVNYKELKKLNKYDPGMSPISSGYQSGDNYVQPGTIDQYATPITNAFMPEALSKAASTATGLFGLGKAAYSSLTNAGKIPVGSLPGLSFNDGEATVQPITEALGEPKTASQLFKGAGSKVLGAAAALHGGIESIATADAAGRAPLSATDLLNSSSRYRLNINGVDYDTYGGYDVAGANKYLKDFNNANMIKQISSGVEFGAGIGSFLGPLGTGLGALGGALGGAITGWINRGKAKDKMREIQRNTNNAIAGYNWQSEAEAATQGIKNEYFRTHADTGKGVGGAKPNSLIGPGEIVGSVDKYGNIIRAFQVQGGPGDVHGHDTIPAKLGDRDFVIGNKINPFTGNEYSAEGAVYADMFNNGDPAGEQGLQQLLKMQKITKRNNPYTDMSRYNCGKGLSRRDAGLAYSIIPMGLGMASGYAGLKQAQRDPVQAYQTYVANPNAAAAFAAMPKSYDVSDQLVDATDQARYAQYAINQSPYSGGARMAMMSNLYNNLLNNRTKIFANKRQQENALAAAYANLMYQSGEQEAARLQNSNTAYYQQLAQAQARKRAQEDTYRNGILDSVYKGFENMFNWDMFKENVGLYREKLTQDAINDLVKTGKTADEARRAILRNMK